MTEKLFDRGPKTSTQAKQNHHDIHCFAKMQTLFWDSEIHFDLEILTWYAFGSNQR